MAFDGVLNADIPSIRKLAAVSGTSLTPSTAQGAIYENFSLSGKATGSPTSVSFSGATVILDALRGTGAINAHLAKGKPFLTGTLDMDGLDVRPYMAAMEAQNPSGAIQPWSQKELNLTALTLFDGTFDLSTPNIMTGRMELGQTDLKAVIKNGILTANLPNANLYGGKGDLDISLNAAQSVPSFSMDFQLDEMNAKGFLGAAANFTKLTGSTGTNMKFSGSGKSIDQMMRSMNGGGNFKVSEGVITGVNIAEFVTGLDAAFQSRSLPPGLGGSYTTPFSKLDGLFTIKDGVATIGDFAINAHDVRAEGRGKLDIGNQTLDFSLRPRLPGQSGLAGIGIPIRLSGSFGSIKAGLDTDLLGQVIAEQAKVRLQKEISGQLGGILELGGNSQETPVGETAPNTDPVEGLLNNLLGGTSRPENNGQQQQQPADPNTPKPADPVESLLGDLFGTKKPDPEK